MSEATIDIEALFARMREEREADKKESAEDMRRILRSEMEAEAARKLGLPDETLGSVFKRWDREVLDPVGRESERSDGETVAAFVPLVLDLPFRYGDENACRPPLLQGWITLRPVPLSSVTIDMGEAWRRELKITPKRKPRKRGAVEYYADGTINRVTGLFQGAVKWRLGGDSAKSPIRALRHEDTEKDARKGYFRDEEQFEEFLRLCKPMLVDMLRLSANNGGMRKAEILGLRIDEIDWVERQIRFAPGKRTKNRKGRIFPVRDQEWDMVLRRKAAAEAIGSPFLFHGRRDNPKAPIPSRTVVDWMRQAVRKWTLIYGADANLNGESPVFHHMRHTWATWAGAKGYGFDAIMDEGGWIDPKIAKRYKKRSAKVVENARRLLSRTVREAAAEDEPQPRARKRVAA